MALPKILQKLFANGGAGPKLRPEIMPIQTVDGYEPDASGNVDTKRLPLSGGTMTGPISSSEKSFNLSQTNKDGRVLICGGNGERGGACVELYGKDHQYRGVASIISTDGTYLTQLLLNPTGSMTWGGSEVERVNGTGVGYIKYDTGIQVCWGSLYDAISNENYVTYPSPFIEPPILICFAAGASGSGFVLRTGYETTTSFQFLSDAVYHSGGDLIFRKSYIAWGKWR